MNGNMIDKEKTQALGAEKIPRLLLKYAIPSIIAMLSSSLYNMIDSIFIGHGVGAMAISGLAITMPIMNVIAALGTLVSVGAATLMSVKLGQGDKASAEYILGNLVVLNIIIGLTLTVLGNIFLDEILYFFGASEHTIPYAREFMRIILSGTVVTHIYLSLNDMLRASGYPGRAMTAILLAIAINCVLNPLLIFGFGWGIAGSATATVTAQVVVMCWELWHFSDKSHFIHFKRQAFSLSRRIVKGMLGIGISPFLMNICASVVVIFINRSLMEYGNQTEFGGDFYVGAFGIVNRVLMVFVMIVIGLNQGLQPIIGYNFGAKKVERVASAVRYGVLCAVSVTTVGFILGQTIPHAMAAMFTTDAVLTDLAVRGMHIALLVFPIVGLQMVTAAFFQSIGKVNKAILLSLTRQMLFLVPLLAILPHFLGTDGVWLSMPVADLASTLLAVYLLRRQIRQFREEDKKANIKPVL